MSVKAVSKLLDRRDRDVVGFVLEEGDRRFRYYFREMNEAEVCEADLEPTGAEGEKSWDAQSDFRGTMKIHTPQGRREIGSLVIRVQPNGDLQATQVLNMFAGERVEGILRPVQRNERAHAAHVDRRKDGLGLLKDLGAKAVIRQQWDSERVLSVAYGLPKYFLPLYYGLDLDENCGIAASIRSDDVTVLSFEEARQRFGYLRTNEGCAVRSQDDELSNRLCLAAGFGNGVVIKLRSRKKLEALIVFADTPEVDQIMSSDLSALEKAGENFASSSRDLMFDRKVIPRERSKLSPSEKRLAVLIMESVVRGETPAFEKFGVVNGQVDEILRGVEERSGYGLLQ